jgi:hypothetical protein
VLPWPNSNPTNDTFSTGTLGSWEIPSSDADDDDSEWEEAPSKSGIENDALEEGSTKPIDIELGGLSKGQRYRSPEQTILSLKSLITSHITVSLRPKEEEASERFPRSHLVEERKGDLIQRKRSKSI